MPFSRINHRLINSTRSVRQRAYILQLASLPFEILAVWLCFHMYESSLSQWINLAYIVILTRIPLTWMSIKKNHFYSFIISQTLSMFLWMSFGLMLAKGDDVHLLTVCLILCGVVAGSIGFIAYIRYLFVAYALIALFPFAAIMAFKGGSIAIYGIGVLILLVFLIMLAEQYHQIISNYLGLTNANELLLEEQRLQAHEFRKLRTKVRDQIKQRAALEQQVIHANQKMEQTLALHKMQMDELNEDFEQLIEGTDLAIMMVNPELDSLILSKPFLTLFNLDAEKSQQFRYIFEQMKAMLCEGKAFLSGFPFNRPRDLERLQLVDGRIIDTELHILQGREGLAYYWLFFDKTEEVQANDTMGFLLNHDPLTSLPGRDWMLNLLQNRIDEHKGSETLFAVCMIDLDDFKLFNDSFGHEFGDRILKALGTRIKDAIRSCDTVGRMGGDEFLCMIYPLNYKQDAIPLVQKMMAAITQPIILEDRHLLLSASIGVSFYPSDALMVHDLINHADMALHQAKAEGKNNFSLYSRMMSSTFNSLHERIQQFRQVMQNEGFLLEYQPILNQKGQLVRLEALIRWPGGLTPSELIAIAEKTNMIMELNQWIIHHVAKDINHIKEKLPKDVKVSINLSANLIARKNLIQEMIALLQEEDCSPSMIELEIPERAFSQYQQLNLLIKQAKNAGFSLALDDFGTGFSSLAHLKANYFDVIKLDDCFVGDLESQIRAQDLLRCILKLTELSGAKTVIKGVAQASTNNICKRYGDVWLQGNFIAKPINIEQIEFYLKSHGLI